MLFNNLKKTLNILTYKEKINFLFISLITFVVTFFELISLGSIPVYISLIFDPSLINKYLIKVNLSNFENVHDSENFIYYSSFFLVAVFLIKNIFISISYFFNIKFIFNLRIRLGKQIYKNNIYSDYLNHIERSPAELIRNHNEITRFSGLIGHYQRLLLEIVLLTLLLIVTLNVYFEITILFFGLFSIFFLIYFISIRKWLNAAGIKQQVYKKIEFSLLDKTFSGIKEIKLNLKENFFKKLFNDNYFKMNRLIFLIDLINKVPKISLEMLAIITITVISVFFYQSDLSNTEIISSLSFLSVVAIRFIPAFNGISMAAAAIKYVKPSLDIIEKDLKNISNYSKSINKKVEHYSNKIKNIKLENLTFNYGVRNNSLLENVNFVIEENDKIGIFGKSGSGKTSIINLITGLIEPIKGNIYFNEINIRDKINIFYNKISYVTQDNILFDDSILNNITFNSKTIDKSKLDKVIKICKLNEFIKDSSQGIDLNIGEKGLKLSGGQKQRIGIARALYKNFDILILDEATSAINKDYEKEILQSINENFNDKIIIIVSHNSNNFKSCNKIISIKNNNLQIENS